MSSSFLRSGIILLGVILMTSSSLFGQAFDLYPGGTYDAGIPSPEQYLGFKTGERGARHPEVVAYFTMLAERSKKIRFFEIGKSHEDRTLIFAIISSEQNIERYKEVQEKNRKLADPRLLSDGEAANIAKSNPAVVWAGYGVHGDEVSSIDAALALAYQLVAGTDDRTVKILKEVIVGIDPLQNPDGRERFLGQMEQWRSKSSSTDVQDVRHTGVWPGGRGNHYLFDLNRDWFAQIHPESRAKLRTVLEWNPQLVIDSHEMGSWSTYFFAPPKEPINPNIGKNAHKWWKIFAEDQAAAHDRFGWSYFTREMFDEWYPGYGSSWPLYYGAIGILYEQAGVDASAVKRPDGTILTYKETIHRQFTSSMANLLTVANNREEFLKDFYNEKKTILKTEPGKPRAYYVIPGKNKTAGDRFVERMLMQGIEIREADKEFRVANARDIRGNATGAKTMPIGTLIVETDQPMGRLASAILDFDVRFSTEALTAERRSLEKDGRTQIYDVTAWSLLVSSGMEGYSSMERSPIAGKPIEALNRRLGILVKEDAGYGFLFSNEDDRFYPALAATLAAGLKVRIGEEEFAVEGKKYPPGSALLRKNENPNLDLGLLKTIAETAGIEISGAARSKSDTGPDLGGEKFALLREPRIALVTGGEISGTSFGVLWHLLDQRLKMRITLLLSTMLGGADLAKYNVILLPSGGGLQRILGKNELQRLKTWVSEGGTLIAIGNSSAYLADTAQGFVSTRLLHQSLAEKSAYALALDWERRADEVRVDSDVLWSGRTFPATKKDEKPDPASLKELLTLDERARLFMPRGALLKANLDTEHWLAYGMNDEVPAFIFTSHAFVSKPPVQTAARLADKDSLRISGLLWPEARERWANTAYLTRERVGSGQVILFADEPVFRGFYHGTERLLLNALLLGPGMGTPLRAEW